MGKNSGIPQHLSSHLLLLLWPLGEGPSLLSSSHALLFILISLFLLTFSLLSFLLSLGENLPLPLITFLFWLDIPFCLCLLHTLCIWPTHTHLRFLRVRSVPGLLVPFGHLRFPRTCRSAWNLAGTAHPFCLPVQPPADYHVLNDRFEQLRYCPVMPQRCAEPPPQRSQFTVRLFAVTIPYPHARNAHPLPVVNNRCHCCLPPDLIDMPHVFYLQLYLPVAACHAPPLPAMIRFAWEPFVPVGVLCSFLPYCLTCRLRY